RIFSAEGVQASMSIGSSVNVNPPNWAGIRFSCTARFRRNSTDFLTHTTVSEWVMKENPAIETNGYGPNGYEPPMITMLLTNLDTGLRVQLPKGNGIFFLDRSRHESPYKNIGVLIDPF